MKKSNVIMEGAFTVKDKKGKVTKKEKFSQDIKTGKLYNSKGKEVAEVLW